MILGKYVYDEPLRGDEPNRIVYRPQAWYSVEGYLYELDPDEDVESFSCQVQTLQFNTN